MEDGIFLYIINIDYLLQLISHFLSQPWQNFLFFISEFQI